MVRTYHFNPSLQTSNHLPGVSDSHPTNSVAVPLRTPPRVRQKALTSKEECPFSLHYKEMNMPNESHHNKLMEDETTVFGVRSVVIDGQRFYQPLDQHLNRALNDQFAALKPQFHYQPNVSKHNDPVSTALMKFAEHPPQDPIMHKKYDNHHNDRHHNNRHHNDRHHNDRRIDHKIDRHIEESQYFHDGFDSKHQVEAETHNGKMIENDLPWARGNPQPKSGKRGTLEWSFGQRTRPFADFSPVSDYKPYNSNWLNDSFQYASKRPSNLYQTSSQEAYSYLDPPKPINYPLNSSLNSFNSEPLTNYVNPFKYGTSPEERKRYDQEQHRLDLLRQIEDNNRRKMLERHREWEEDQRDRWRSEITMQRQRDEVEKEQRDVQKRQLAAEAKAQQVAYDRPSSRWHSKNREPKRSPKRETRRASPTSSELEPQLEWWEKKKPWHERQISSPAIPALRGGNNHQDHQEMPSRQSRADSLAGYSASRLARRSVSNEHHAEVERPVSLPSRQSRSQSRNSRRSYQPSIVSRAGSNSSALRGLSATRHRIEREYAKVKEAVNKNQYDSRVFD
ncbi:hypothetical protein M3Y97_00799700 [Aphelenchoides bicaudatus]|nr:hypothetical protein M3Y97_00799700 [Aphelenchoides bicaudatus]